MTPDITLTELHDLLERFGEAHGKRGFAGQIAEACGGEWVPPDKARSWCFISHTPDGYGAVWLQPKTAIAALTTAFWKEAAGMGCYTFAIRGESRGWTDTSRETSGAEYPDDTATMIGLLRSVKTKKQRDDDGKWARFASDKDQECNDWRDMVNCVLELRDRLDRLEKK